MSHPVSTIPLARGKSLKVAPILLAASWLVSGAGLLHASRSWDSGVQSAEFAAGIRASLPSCNSKYFQDPCIDFYSHCRHKGQAAICIGTCTSCSDPGYTERCDAGAKLDMFNCEAGQVAGGCGTFGIGDPGCVWFATLNPPCRCNVPGYGPDSCRAFYVTSSGPCDP